MAGPFEVMAVLFEKIWRKGTHEWRANLPKVGQKAIELAE